MEQLLRFIRDFNERQSQLFAMTVSFLVRYESPELQPLVDEDITEAAAALAATFETASRGVIYEHRPASLAAERLLAALKPLLSEAGQHAGAAFERDAAVVMRRLAEAVGELRALAPGNRRAFVELLGRTMRKSGPAEGQQAPAPDQPRLIVP